jgi:phosphatidate cytidylyltransferase
VTQQLPEYRRRFVGGTLLVLVAVAMLWADQWCSPFYPFLLVFSLALTLLAAWEMHTLMEGQQRPPLWLCLLAVGAVVAAGWPAHQGWFGAPKPWQWVQTAFVGVVFVAFLWEMAWFRQPDGAVQRIGALVLITAYLGLLPAYFVQLRWLEKGVAALCMAAFVPKAGDAVAWAVGTGFGRTRMTPVLSPKKTWEGFFGGLAGSGGMAVGINWYTGLLPEWWHAALFGLTVGLAGVLGDLAESLIKRDCEKKDASDAVPGIGGILDVIDSVLFAAPVAFWWLAPWPGP